MGMTKSKEPLQCVEVKNLDAVRSECGWNWNNSWVIREWSIPVSKIDQLYKPRVLLRRLREEGVLSYESRGLVRVEVAEGDPTFLEIVDRSSGMPMFAIVIPWGRFDTETNPFETDSEPNPATRAGNHRSPFGPGA